MILDVLKNKDLYLGLHDGFEKAFAFIESCNETTEAGRYEIDGDKVYALVQSYTTKTEASLEAHKKYIDIQYIILGSEIIQWANIEKLIESIAYDETKDVGFYSDSNESTDLYMTAGSFAILYPEDAHKPCMSKETPCEVKKVVVKIRMD